MKKCPRCSAKNSNSNARCSKCGCKLTSVATAAAETAVNRRIIAVIAAVVILVVIPVAMMIIQNNTNRVVLQSAEKMLAAFSEAAAESEILSGFTAALQEVKATDSYRITAHVSSVDYELGCDMSYALSRERMSGNLIYTNRKQGKTIPFEIYANDKEVRLLAPMLTEEAYGFTFADLAKKKGITVKELAVYEPFSLAATLESVAGKAWDAFLKSVEAEKFGERSLRRGAETIPCTVYKVSWDPEKAKALTSALTPGGLLSVPVDLLNWLTGADSDCRCYLDEEGCLVGLDWVVLGTKYTLVFEGTDNIWREITLTTDSLLGGKTVYVGGVGAKDGKWQLRLADGANVFFEFLVDERTGAFTVTMLEQDPLSGIFVMEQELVGVELTQNTGHLGEVRAAFAFGPLVSQPEERDFKYTDILHLSAAELQRLLIDVTG